MSTYNGELYLNDQIESLLGQDYGSVEILIRDDGSKDRTPEILKEWADHPRIKVFLEENIGVVRSFFRLLSYSSKDAGYLAFSDQDDVWMKEKLSKAVALMAEREKKGEQPLLYCSTALCTDENLKPMSVTDKPKHGVTFENALVESVAAGCTMVINSKTRDILLQKPPSERVMSIVRYHDWWMLQVVTALGEVIFDEEPMICHRRHGRNVSGQEVGLGKWKYRLKKLLASGKIVPLTEQAEEFKRLYGGMLSPDKVYVLERLINERKTLVGRIRYAFTGPTYRQSRIDDIIFRLMILVNKV
jgi:glycosyltransferase involved in cell wall biosynthesis